MNVTSRQHEPLFRNLAPLVLASASPRRREMLACLGIVFEVYPADVDETPAPGEAAKAFVLRLARDKAAAVAPRFPDRWVLAADTVVVLDGEILGKPSGPDEAAAMLDRLSGRGHEVWTGFCLTRGGKEVARAECTKVRFATFPSEVMRAYVRTGEPLDKAGAYGIQGVGGFLAEAIDGSYGNVVGLPLAVVLQALLAQAVIAPPPS